MVTSFAATMADDDPAPPQVVQDDPEELCRQALVLGDASAVIGSEAAANTSSARTP